ncbi:MAG TPA: DUF1444 family protein [Tepidisphaeraceae bacterium]|nr:DUF1444 family protein [Tepidisphaeraceae bacterium]
MPSLTREQFVEEILKVVPEKFPLVDMAPGDEPFTLKVNGNPASIEDLYRRTVLQPEDMRINIERWVVELLRAAESSPDRAGSFADLKERIFPMLVSELRAQSTHRQTISQPLVEGLQVAYAIDNDRSIAYIPRRQFEAWNITEDELHETALNNLVARSEAMAAQAATDENGNVDLILFQTGDGYDASRILLPTLHERLREYLGTPFAAAIPNRDILICFRNDDATVRRVKSQVEEDFRRMPHQVTDRWFLITPDGIAPGE